MDGASGEAAIPSCSHGVRVSCPRMLCPAPTVAVGGDRVDVAEPALSWTGSTGGVPSSARPVGSILSSGSYSGLSSPSAGPVSAALHEVPLLL